MGLFCSRNLGYCMFELRPHSHLCQSSDRVAEWRTGSQRHCLGNSEDKETEARRWFEFCVNVRSEEICFEGLSRFP